MLNPVYKLKQVGLANNPNLLENCRDFLLKKGEWPMLIKKIHMESIKRLSFMEFMLNQNKYC